jgi:hypothetical protein
MDIKSLLLLKSVIRKMIEAMEILNKIDEKDYREIVLKAQKDEKNIKGVRDSIERGNMFMVAFFLREVIESVCNEWNTK